MSALTITAVDHTTDQLTITAHGLLTGDGFLAIYTPDGGTIPAGLAPVTDYWAIRVDANTLKLASSSANAMLGTAINITSNGSGTLQLLQGLPYRVPRIMTALSQVKSVDLNATWQSFVALWNLLTGQAQSIWSGIKLAANQHVEISGTGRYKHGPQWTWHSPRRGVTETNVVFDNGGMLHASANAASITMPGPELPAGKRPLTIGAKVNGGSGGVQNVQIALVMTNGDGTATTLETLVIVNPPGSWAEYTADINPDVAALAAGKALYWDITIPLQDTYLSNLGVEVDHP
jgi:hypothetical protein